MQISHSVRKTFPGMKILLERARKEKLVGLYLKVNKI